MSEDYQPIQPRIHDPAMAPAVPAEPKAAVGGITGAIGAASTAASSAANGLFTSVYDNRVIVIVIVVVIIVVLCAAYYYKYWSQPAAASPPAQQLQHQPQSPSPPVPPAQPPAIPQAPAQSAPAQSAPTGQSAPAQSAPAGQSAPTPAQSAPAPQQNAFSRESVMESFMRVKANIEKADGVKTESELAELVTPTGAVEPSGHNNILSQCEPEESGEALANAPSAAPTFATATPSASTDSAIDYTVTHGDDADGERCTALTSSGKPCKNRARVNGRCHQHPAPGPV